MFQVWYDITNRPVGSEGADPGFEVREKVQGLSAAKEFDGDDRFRVLYNLSALTARDGTHRDVVFLIHRRWQDDRAPCFPRPVKRPCTERS